MSRRGESPPFEVGAGGEPWRAGAAWLRSFDDEYERRPPIVPRLRVGTFRSGRAWAKEAPGVGQQPRIEAAQRHRPHCPRVPGRTGTVRRLHAAGARDVASGVGEPRAPPREVCLRRVPGCGGRGAARSGERAAAGGRQRLPPMDRARAWWASKEYAEAKGLRQACAATEMVLLEGMPRP
jgi:hypothetical protein